LYLAGQSTTGHLLVVFVVVEDGVEAPVGHELVDEEVEVWRGVVAAERDDVAVLDVGHGVQLALEASVHLGAAPVEPLHGERRLVVDPEPVHGAVPARADHVLAGQPHEHAQERLGALHHRRRRPEDHHLAACQAVLDDPLLAGPLLVEQERDEHLGEDEEHGADGDVQRN
jgi:hypothetical protein